MYEKIEKLRSILLSLGLKPPYDIFNICSNLEGIVIGTCPFKTKGLRGMAVMAKDSTDYDSILINSSLSYLEQNFYGTHELIHIYTSEKNSGQTFNCYDTIRPDQNTYIEWIANEGAAELLVPYKILLPMIKSNYSTMITDGGTYDFCKKNAGTFGVSETVLQNRIQSLKYETDQYLKGISLEDIEILSNNQQLKRGIEIKSLVDLENERILSCFKFFEKVSA